jgi:hypothetical protein
MLYRRSELSLTLRVNITNTHRGVLEWLIEVTGLGAIHNKPRLARHHQQGYFWQTHGESAAGLLEQIRPYMRIKTAQADLALDFIARLRVPSLKADKTWLDGYRSQMKLLNHSRSV